jgi:hypothetical protein
LTAPPIRRKQEPGEFMADDTPKPDSLTLLREQTEINDRYGIYVKLP